MKILVIALRAMGDMVLITPILRLLKTFQPGVEITLVVDAIGHEVLLNSPYIDQMLVIDRNQNRKLPLIDRIQMEIGFFNRLRRKRFDVAVDLFGGPRSALMAWLSRAPRRYGEEVPGDFRSRLYNHRTAVSREGEPLVLQKLKIVRSFIGHFEDDLALELFLTGEEKERGVRSLKRHGVRRDDIVVGFFPGAGWEYRQWPPEKFAALGDRLAKMPGVRIVLIGGVRDQSVCEEVSSRMGALPLTLIQRSVRETMAFIDRLDLFVSNDTGPMHIAVALGRPTIALFGPGNTIKYGPWRGNAVTITKNLLCSPCPQWFDPCKKAGRERQECMRRIEVEEVFQAALSFLDVAEGSEIRKRGRR